MTVPRAPITIGIIVIFMFQDFFDHLARSRYLSLLSHSFNFTLRSAGTEKSSLLQVLFYLLIIIRSGHLAEIWWSVCLSKSQMIWCVSFSKTDYGLFTYNLFLRSNFYFLHSSQWITLPTQSCLVLYSICDNLLHSLMRLIALCFSPHYPHLLFCYVLSILTLIWLVLMVLFWAAIRRDSVSLLRFPFLTHIHFFSCEVSLSSRLKRP